MLGKVLMQGMGAGMGTGSCLESVGGGQMDGRYLVKLGGWMDAGYIGAMDAGQILCSTTIVEHTLPVTPPP